MSANRAYLDWNATTPLHGEARAAMLVAMERIGNPSSIHAEGRAARALMEAARADVAALVNGEPENVMFTSGATEALNAVLKQGLIGCCGRDLGGILPVIVGATEHSAVLAAAGPDARLIAVDRNGLIDLPSLEALLEMAGPALVAVQLANNETGVIQPIANIAHIVHAAGGALVVDGVQAPGKLPLDIKALAADALILSAHKFGGPQGVGAIIFSENRIRLAAAHLAGGGQERGQRGGTENLIGIAGMGAAAAQIDLAAANRMEAMREGFEARLKAAIPDFEIFGHDVSRLCNTSLISIPDLSAERALVACDLAGIAVSSGSACSSGAVKASHVLKAMGVGAALSAGAIRVSIGPTTDTNDILRCEEVLLRLTQQKRADKAA